MLAKGNALYIFMFLAATDAFQEKNSTIIVCHVLDGTVIDKNIVDFF